MKREFICICCPKGCHITVDGDVITGYTCKRGLQYVKEELTNPTRTLTSTVKVTGGHILVCPVRSEKPIPKDKMFEAMKIINSVTVEAPIKYHQIIVSNILNTGINIISTEEI